MDFYIQIPRLEVKYRNILRLQPRRLVSHVHPHPVNNVVAVRLNHQLPPPSSHLAKHGAQRGLGLGMQVDFGLLQEKYSRHVRAQQFRQNRQSLANAISNVDQVAPWPFPAFAEFTNLYLKRVAI